VGRQTRCACVVEVGELGVDGIARQRAIEVTQFELTETLPEGGDLVQIVVERGA